jgi:hypothetical protein
MKCDKCGIDSSFVYPESGDLIVCVNCVNAGNEKCLVCGEIENWLCPFCAPDKSKEVKRSN